MDTQQIVKSKTFKKTLYIIGVLLAMLIIFQAGIFVGYRKAAFSYRWGENYYRAFDGKGEHKKFFMRIPPGELPNAHGAAGEIVKISLPTFILEDQDNIEKIVRINEGAAIRRFRDAIKPTDLASGDFVVVIGSPNDAAEIEAKLIRVMPPPPDFFNSYTPPPKGTNTPLAN